MTTKRPRRSKELKAVVEALNNYIDKHKGNVVIAGGLVAFDKKGEVVDDLTIGYGYKNVMKIAVEELLKEIKKEKEDFINW